MKQEQIQEWTENPVTRELLGHITSQVKEIQEALGDAYHPFQPEKTQEVMAQLHGTKDAWEFTALFLTGDWSYFDEEVDDGE